MNVSDITSGKTMQQENNCQIAVHPVIAGYKLLSALSAQMREAAIQGEWDKLVEIERQRSQQIAAIEAMDATAVLNEAAQQHKAQLINKILADDADIRKHTEAWMGQFQRAMQNNRQEQRLQQAYGGA